MTFCVISKTMYVLLAFQLIMYYNMYFGKQVRMYTNMQLFDNIATHLFYDVGT